MRDPPQDDDGRDEGEQEPDQPGRHRSLLFAAHETHGGGGHRDRHDDRRQPERPLSASEVWMTNSSVKPLRHTPSNSPTDPNPTETMTIVTRMRSRTTP